VVSPDGPAEGSTHTTRKVEFVVVRVGVSPETLAAEIGTPSDSTWFHTGQRIAPDVREVESAWDVVAEGTGDHDLDVLIGAVLSRVRQLRNRLTPVCANADTSCLLRVVQHVAYGDRIGPGFALDTEDCALLAELNAFIDVDQYWEPPVGWEPPEED
jgi:hypothetical protein